MKAKVDPTLAPETIWLLLHEGEGGSHVWCDQPDPTGNGEHDAVEYVRLDVATAWMQAATRPRAATPEVTRSGSRVVTKREDET
jgi:hypothetical protein